MSRTPPPAARLVAIAVLSVLSLWGCANYYSSFVTASPVTEGFRTEAARRELDERLVYVVSVDHEWVRDVAVKWLKERGHTVVDGVVLQKIIDEHKLTMTNTPDDERRIMVAAKLAGAQDVLFGTSKISTEVEPRRIITEHGGLGQKPTYYDVTVTLRSIDLHTGNLAWRATARYADHLGYPVAGLVSLTTWALARGMCPTDAGFVWKEPKGIDTPAGCFRQPE
ncbi:MAG TPA: hypothetical protein VFA38_07465 [Nitrospirales bacterium]|nr:hypothetical protein [Nitrospirales bacterium]